MTKATCESRHLAAALQRGLVSWHGETGRGSSKVLVIIIATSREDLQTRWEEVCEQCDTDDAAIGACVEQDAARGRGKKQHAQRGEGGRAGGALPAMDARGGESGARSGREAGEEGAA